MQAHPALPVQIHETHSGSSLFTPNSLLSPHRDSSGSHPHILTSLPRPTTTIFHIFTPYQHHLAPLCLLLPAPSPCLSVRPSVRPLRRGPNQQSNNPTYEQTQCQNPLRPRTVVRDATLPRTSDQIASLRTKFINTKLRVSVPIPIPIAAPIPIPTPQTTRASHPLINSGKPLPIPREIRHKPPRDPVRIRVVRARDRMDSGARSSPVPFYRYPLLLFFCFCVCVCFCFLLLLVHPRAEPRASGLRLRLRLRPHCWITETISASLRLLLCPLPSARWHVLQYLQPSTAMLPPFPIKHRDLP